MKCTECGKEMVPQFIREGGKLAGWSCDCAHTVAAIGRERLFTKETYYGDKANKR